MPNIRLLLLALMLAGCGGNLQESAHGFSKAIEAGAYDRAASIASEVCANVHDRGLWIQRTRIEARREIRQSTQGRFGPKPPEGLPPHLVRAIGKNTLNGRGPIVRIYCENDDVPMFIWEELAREWRD